MSRSTEPSTASQITIEEPASVPLIGGRGGAIGSEKTLAELMKARGGWEALTEQDHARIKAEREAERRRAIDSAAWHEASLSQLTSNKYDLPKGVVDERWHWCDRPEFLPPSLSQEQIAELDEEIEAYEHDMMAAGPEATAVILRSLASVVIVPERDDMDLAMQLYLEDLQGYPEHVLADVTREWRRTEKFWPTIAELRERCNKHKDGLGVLQRELKKLYLLRAVANNPAPDTLVTMAWVREREQERNAMVYRFDRFKPRKRIEADKTPKLALAS